MLSRTPKFVKKYADLAAEIDKAVSSYAAEVRARSFPSAEYLYSRPKEIKKEVS
jgi:3-methyl-2-oxobutanoate hydroxymethyltransferase